MSTESRIRQKSNRKRIWRMNKARFAFALDSLAAVRNGTAGDHQRSFLERHKRSIAHALATRKVQHLSRDAPKISNVFGPLIPLHFKSEDRPVEEGSDSLALTQRRINNGLSAEMP